MANIITSQTIVDGSRNTVLKINILGDGSGEETDTVLVDASALSTSDMKIMKVQASLIGFSAKLIFDATANVDALSLSADDDIEQCYKGIGGIINNAGAGKTGDILISTTGLGAGDSGHIVLELKKKDAV